MSIVVDETNSAALAEMVYSLKKVVETLQSDSEATGEELVHRMGGERALGFDSPCSRLCSQRLLGNLDGAMKRGSAKTRTLEGREARLVPCVIQGTSYRLHCRAVEKVPDEAAHVSIL